VYLQCVQCSLDIFVHIEDLHIIIIIIIFSAHQHKASRRKY